MADLQDFVDQEVAGKGGLSGGVIKTGYAAVKKVRPGIIRSAIDSMLDEFVAALEPYWAAYRSQPVPGFGAFLAGRPHEVAQSLLAVTDRRAAAVQPGRRHQRLRQAAPQGRAERHRGAAAAGRPGRAARPLSAPADPRAPPARPGGPVSAARSAEHSNLLGRALGQFSDPMGEIP